MRPPHALPRLCYYAPRRAARVVLGGHSVYCGSWDMDRDRPTPQARARYDKVIQQWLAAGRRWPPPEDPCESVADLAERYHAWASTYYLRDGKPTTHVARLASALALLHRSGLGDVTPDAFTPMDLERFQSWLAADPRRRWSRSTINTYTGLVEAMFDFGVRRGLVRADVRAALRSVPGLRRGRAPAPGIAPPREGRSVRPADPARIEAVRAHAPPQLAAMMDVQRLTGMRPGELVPMRRDDIAPSRERGLWWYTPPRHKTQHLGRPRRIPIGPRAMAIIEAHAPEDTSLPVFSPRRARAPRAASPGPHAGEAYSVASYRRAISRACARASRAAYLAHCEASGETPQPSTPAAHRWSFSPHQLRHTAASELVEHAPVEVAREALGHAHIATTMGYIEVADRRLARAVKRRG